MVSPNLPHKATLMAALFFGCCLSSTALAADRPSVFDPQEGQFRLHAELSTAQPARVVRFGPRAAAVIPLLGDWNGDGVDTLGLYDPVEGKFMLRNSNQNGSSDIKFRFGPRRGSTLPVSGDWNGDGIDTVAVYDVARGRFHLADLNAASTRRQTFRFGPLGGTLFPVAGDWDGDGVDTVGLFDQGSSVFHLRNSNGGGPADIKLTFEWWEGDSLPLAGDWTESGVDSVGIYRPQIRQFRLRASPAPGKEQYVFNARGENRGLSWPVAGQWQRAKKPTEVDVRLNAGGKDLLDSQGLAWVGDDYFKRGVGVQASPKKTRGVDPLFRTSRRPRPGAESLTYKLPVPNGLYKIDLYFTELDHAQSGTFDVEIEGQQLIQKLDVLAEAGANVALRKIRKVTVEDQQLSIELKRVVGEPQIAAIRVRGLESSEQDSSPSTPKGSLSGDVARTSRTVDLTADGTADWAHYGRKSDSDVNRKAGGGSLIGPVVPLGANGESFTNRIRSTYGWTDGASIRAANDVAQGLKFRGKGAGFEMTVPADKTARTLTLYVGGFQSKARLEARLSDGSANPFSVSIEDSQRTYDRTITLKYQAASAGQVLTISYQNLSATGNVSLAAATLKGPGASEEPGKVSGSGPKPEPKPEPKPKPKPQPQPKPKPKPQPQPKPKPEPIAYKMILRWAPNPEPVLGYRVYFGPNRSTTVLELRDLRVAQGDINPNAPRASFKVKDDLGLSAGEEGCFRVVAYNVVGDSKFSEPVCGKI